MPNALRSTPAIVAIVFIVEKLTNWNIETELYMKSSENMINKNQNVFVEEHAFGNIVRIMSIMSRRDPGAIFARFVWRGHV